MAEATLNDLIKVMRQRDANESFSDNQMLTMQESVKDELGKLNKMLGSFFLREKANAGDKLEAEREKREKKDTVQRAKGKQAKDGGSGFGLGDAFGLGSLISSLPKMILPLTGGLAALSLAFAGFRGWELDAIKKIDMMKALPLTLTNGLVKLRNLALGIFGLTAEGLVTRNAQGQFEKVPPISKQIKMRLNALRINALKLFGLGVDGKPIALKGSDGLFKNNIIGRVTFQINRLLKPLMNITEGVAEFATGSGKKLFSFISGNILGGAKVVGGMIKKVLWPLGFIFALFDGVQAYRNSDEEGFIAKLGDGIGGFVGDLIGAPFDMLKGAVRWLFNKAFGLEVDPDTGKVTNEEAGMAKMISDSIGEFSFEKFFGGLAKVPFKILTGIVSFFTADSEEKNAMQQQGIDKIKEWGKSFADWIYSFMPSLDGLKSYFRSTLKEKLPTKLYEFLYGAPSEPITGVSDSELRAIMAKVDERNESTASKAEATKNLNSGLSQFDVNGDGFLSGQEFGKANIGKSARTLQALLAQYGETQGLSSIGVTTAIMGRQGLDLSMPQSGGGAPAMSAVDARNQSSNNTSNITNVQTRLASQDRGLNDGI